MAFEQHPDELGALWSRSYVRDGVTLTRLTGTIDGVEVVCWPVDRQHDNQPSFRVKRSRPRVAAQGDTPAAPAPVAAPITADDIPF
tara:strand:+ start:1130 stop:1387 length:258 start_codon:yes stop_codon:yes gene_type:complete